MINFDTCNFMSGLMESVHIARSDCLTQELNWVSFIYTFVR